MEVVKSDIYDDWTPCFYWIKKKEIMLEFENRHDEQRRLPNLKLHKFNDDAKNNEEMLEAISTWTGKDMTVQQWKEYEQRRMRNVLLLELRVVVNNRKEFDLKFKSLYPGQLGLWCSTLLKKINKCEYMKDESDIVCV